MNDSHKFLLLDPTEGKFPPNTPDMIGHCEDSLPTDLNAKKALSELVAILQGLRQDPVTQLSGYLITEDPTYLPEGTDARAIARRVGRDKLLETLIELYIDAYQSEDQT